MYMTWFIAYSDYNLQIKATIKNIYHSTAQNV
jgi:hypothetical protein